MLRLRPLTWAMLLGGLFLIFRAVGTPVRGVDDNEAWLLWITHDTAPMVGAIGDVARAMRQNAGDMLTLLIENPRPPVYIAILDLWRMIAGEDMLVGRWLSALLGLVALAVSLRGAYRLRLDGKASDVLFVGLLMTYGAATIGAESLVMLLCAIGIWATIGYRRMGNRRDGIIAVLCAIGIIASAPTWHINMVVALLIPPIVLITLKLIHLKPGDTIHVAYNPLFAISIIFLVCSLIGYQFLAVWIRQDWQTIIQTSMANRTLNQPLVIAYPPQHPLAYYDRSGKVAYQRGVVVNIGWRDFSADELATIAQSIAQSDVIWMVAPIGERRTETLANQLQGHLRVFLTNTANILPQRLTRR